LNTKKTASFIFIAAILFFCIGLLDKEFVKIGCRYGLFAMEIRDHGLTLFPMLYGEPYPDYPSTHTLLIHLASKALGGVTPLSAALPSALAAALTVMMTYLLGSLRSQKLGIYGALLALCTHGFVAEARIPCPDHFVAALTVNCFYAVYTSDTKEKRLRLLLVPLCLLLSFIIRGPIGIVIPSAVIFIYYAIKREIKKLILFSIVSGAILALCIAGMLWAVYLEGGEKLLKTVIDAQVSGRFSKAKPFFYYFTKGMGIYAISLPLAFFAAIASWKKLFRKDSSYDMRFMSLLAGWILIIMIGLSIPGTKHMRYILPAIPAASILAAFIFVNPDKKAIFEKVKNILLLIFKFAPPVLLAAAWAGFVIIKAFAIDISYPLIATSVIFLILTYASLVLAQKQKSLEAKEFAILTAGAITFLSLHLLIIEPVIQSLEGSSAFVALAEKSRGDDKSLVFYRIGPDGEDIKYMVNLKKTFKPKFIWEFEELFETPNSVAIVKESDYKKLPDEIKDKCKVTAKGKLGHKETFAVQPVKK
jgi:4-amino-4-deoxy-L-arabinose transferase-like glycosyltransferase